jgi:hypothetical protein
MAVYADKAPFKKIVGAYFAAHPELLDALLDDPGMREIRDALAAVKRRVSGKKR